MKEPTNNRLPSSAFLLFHVRLMTKSGRVAQRITRLPTEQKIAGSSPAVVEIFSCIFFTLRDLWWQHLKL